MYLTFRTVSQTNRGNRRNEGCTENPYTNIHDRLLSLLCTGNAMQSGGVNLVLWVQIFPLGKMMR